MKTLYIIPVLHSVMQFWCYGKQLLFSSVLVGIPVHFRICFINIRCIISPSWCKYVRCVVREERCIFFLRSDVRLGESCAGWPLPYCAVQQSSPTTHTSRIFPVFFIFTVLFFFPCTWCHLRCTVQPLIIIIADDQWNNLYIVLSFVQAQWVSNLDL